MMAALAIRTYRWTGLQRTGRVGGEKALAESKWHMSEYKLFVAVPLSSFLRAMCRVKSLRARQSHAQWVIPGHQSQLLVMGSSHTCSTCSLWMFAARQALFIQGPFNLFLSDYIHVWVCDEVKYY